MGIKNLFLKFILIGLRHSFRCLAPLSNPFKLITELLSSHQSKKHTTISQGITQIGGKATKGSTGGNFGLILHEHRGKSPERMQVRIIIQQLKGDDSGRILPKKEFRLQRIDGGMSFY